MTQIFCRLLLLLWLLCGCDSQEICASWQIRVGRLLARLLPSLALAAGETPVKRLYLFPALGQSLKGCERKLCSLLPSPAWHTPLEGVSLPSANTSHVITSLSAYWKA